jgi:acetylornithine deacetylase/succinyl-diaminopimelate desuccinylase-like protein
MKTLRLAAMIAITLPQAALAQEKPMGPLRPDQAAFRALYQELIETNTTLSSGSCTLAAQKLEKHLRAAGFPASDVSVFFTPEKPKEGGLTAILRGTSTTARPMLLMGHLDVVEARRADWTRDPFKLVEENGYFFARGSSDMKPIVATWVDALMRFKREGYRPKRSIKLALTCGEETTYAFNGMQWLTKNRPEALSAAFALNEGGNGLTDGKGKVMIQTMQVGEKAVQNFRLETVNAGGHSSVPIRDNAIYQRSEALVKLRDYQFPLKMTPTTRAYYAMTGTAMGGETGRAMVALSKNPGDKAAEAIVSKDRTYNSMLRTTCVATLLDGGHANNALPQRAGANVNCRIYPGETVDATLATLRRVIGDAGVKITVTPPLRPLAVPPPLDPKIMGPAEKLVAKYFPGVPLVPKMFAATTDGVFVSAAGIPVYGVPGGWLDPDNNGTHGLNERRSVRSVYVGRDFLTELVKAYADRET